MNDKYYDELLKKLEDLAKVIPDLRIKKKKTDVVSSISSEVDKTIEQTKGKLDGLVKEGKKHIEEFTENVSREVEQLKNELKEEVKEKIVDEASQKVKIGVIDHSLDQSVQKVRENMNSIRKMHENIDQGIDTVKNVLNTREEPDLLETIAKRINNTLEAVKEEYELIKKTGSLKNRDAQISEGMNNIKEKVGKFLDSGNDEDLKGLHVKETGKKWFEKEMNDWDKTLKKINETKKNISRNIDEKGGVIEYIESLAQKGKNYIQNEAINTAKNRVDKVEKIDKLHTLYENREEVAQKIKKDPVGAFKSFLFELKGNKKGMSQENNQENQRNNKL